MKNKPIELKTYSKDPEVLHYFCEGCGVEFESLKEYGENKEFKKPLCPKCFCRYKARPDRLLPRNYKKKGPIRH